MVAKLPVPEYDPLKVINTVLNERKRYLQFYQSITDDLKEQVKLYLDASGDPGIIKPLNIRDYTNSDDEAESRKNSLINLYSPKPNKAPYEVLEKMRNEHGLLFCPSCGEDGSPGTLDHYLPKTVFPELAVCIANLTPMCSKCQGKKSSDYLTDDGLKAYLHPYYDEIPYILFHVDIASPFDKPSAFSVSLDNKVTGDLRRLVESHIQGVNFKNRFEKFCETKHLHLLRLIDKDRQDKDPMPAKYVVRLFLRQEQEKALNAWGAIYYQSVLNSPLLLEYLDHGELPQFI